MCENRDKQLHIIQYSTSECNKNMLNVSHVRIKYSIAICNINFSRKWKFLTKTSFSEYKQNLAYSYSSWSTLSLSLSLSLSLELMALLGRWGRWLFSIDVCPLRVERLLVVCSRTSLWYHPTILLVFRQVAHRPPFPTSLFSPIADPSFGRCAQTISVFVALSDLPLPRWSTVQKNKPLPTQQRVGC